MAPPLTSSPCVDAHKSLNGPGDARPTAYQILKDEDLIGRMADKTFLVTRGTAGSGLETVRQLAKTGAKVFFTAREKGKARAVVDGLAEKGKLDAELKGGRVEWVKIDHSSLKSVKEGARRVSQTPYTITEDGIKAQLATNHLSHFYLFHLLKSLLLRSSTLASNSRVIVVASASHGMSTVQLGNYNLDQPPKEVHDPLCQMGDNTDHNPTILYGSSKTP